VADAVPPSPEVLDREAAGLDAEALAADFEPARLRLRAAGLRAQAAALRALDAARAALTACITEADAAEHAYAGTAAAEADAARRAIDARFELDLAGDAVRATIKAAPADQVEARMRANAAAEVVGHEEAALGRVRLARQAARAELDAAEHRIADARDRLAAAEAAAVNPAAAELDEATRAQALFWTWQARMVLDASGDPQWRLTEADRELCRANARLWANMCGVGDEAARHKALTEVGAHLRRLRIVAPNGNEIGVSQLFSTP